MKYRARSLLGRSSMRRVGVNLNQALQEGTATVDAGLLRAVFDAVSDIRAALGDRTTS